MSFSPAVHTVVVVGIATYYSSEQPMYKIWTFYVISFFKNYKIFCFKMLTAYELYAFLPKAFHSEIAVCFLYHAYAALCRCAFDLSSSNLSNLLLVKRATFSSSWAERFVSFLSWWLQVRKHRRTETLSGCNTASCGGGESGGIIEQTR